MSQLDDLDLIERQLRPWLAEQGIVREPKDLFERVASGTRGVRQRPGWVVRLLGNGNVGVELDPPPDGGNTGWQPHLDWAPP